MDLNTDYWGEIIYLSLARLTEPMNSLLCWLSSKIQYARKVLAGVKVLASVYVIIASPLGITAPCSFFLCVGLPLWMLLTKFHHPQTKTFCINKRFINLFLMDRPGLFAHTVIIIHSSPFLYTPFRSRKVRFLSAYKVSYYKTINTFMYMLRHHLTELFLLDGAKWIPSSVGWAWQ